MDKGCLVYMYATIFKQERFTSAEREQALIEIIMMMDYQVFALLAEIENGVSDLVTLTDKNDYITIVVM